MIIVRQTCDDTKANAFVAFGVKLAKVCTVQVNLPVTRPHPSTPHGWGTDRSNGAATGSGTGFRASACSRA